MKKTIALFLLFVLLAMTACGQASPAGETPQGGEDAQVQLANPWRDVTEDEARTLCPGSLRAPEGAENVQWSVMESAGQPALVQLSFDLDGQSYTARQQTTNDKAADISGMYYTWTAQTDITLENWEPSAQAGTYSRYIGENEWADLCSWYDAEKGISYTLSVTSRDLDGFDLEAVAEVMCASQAPVIVQIGRQDGERFEAVIMLEGMEEKVQYEHLRNAALGFEMDYDYENFQRLSEADRECFLSIWDDAAKPENYLEVTCRAEDADTVAADLREALSRDYELLEGARELEGAGSCIRIEASVIKGTNNMADQLQVVYIIPAKDGCLVATEHFSVEASEGFGRRFSYMLNTLTVLDS